MQICYIAPVVATATTKVKEMGWVEEQIVSAMQNTFVIPFQIWMHDTWVKFMDVSFVFCLAIAFTGLVCGMLGIEKGKKAAILTLVFYFLLRLFSWMMGWY